MTYKAFCWSVFATCPLDVWRDLVPLQNISIPNGHRVWVSERLQLRLGIFKHSDGISSSISTLHQATAIVWNVRAISILSLDLLNHREVPLPRARPRGQLGHLALAILAFTVAALTYAKLLRHPHSRKVYNTAKIIERINGRNVWGTACFFVRGIRPRCKTSDILWFSLSHFSSKRRQREPGTFGFGLWDARWSFAPV